MAEGMEAKELLRRYYRGEIDATELEWLLMTDADKNAIANLYSRD